MFYILFNYCVHIYCDILKLNFYYTFSILIVDFFKSILKLIINK